LLAFAAGEHNRLRLESAKRINEWLKTDPNLDVIGPIKERSLEIFGDEKRLDQLRDGMTTLFGQLTLAALGCRVCPIPLPFEAGPAFARGQSILIVENNDTWASFSEWNRSAGRFAAVAYAGRTPLSVAACAWDADRTPIGRTRVAKRPRLATRRFA
jgi:hypothetical protein